MPALMTPKNAVTASNMITDPNAQRADLTARGDAQSKRFRSRSNFCRGNDDFVQHRVPNLHMPDAGQVRRLTGCGEAKAR
jgi:hypothetical protein